MGFGGAKLAGLCVAGCSRAKQAGNYLLGLAERAMPVIGGVYIAGSFYAGFRLAEALERGKSLVVSSSPDYARISTMTLSSGFWVSLAGVTFYQLYIRQLWNKKKEDDAKESAVEQKPEASSLEQSVTGY